MAPPLGLGAKLAVTLFMVALATFLARTGREGRWNRMATFFAAVIAAASVVILEFSFPDRFTPGLDGRGVLAGFIGLVTGGVYAIWLNRKTQRPNELQETGSTGRSPTGTH